MRAATAALNKQFDQGVSPQQLVGLLAWHLRVLTGVRLALDEATGRPQARELADQLGLHPFVVTKALQQIPYYSAERLTWLYGELSNLDVALKTSQADPEVLFGLFLSKLATLSVVK
jgi:DNA polymerase-3 subunit delta